MTIPASVTPDCQSCQKGVSPSFKGEAGLLPIPRSRQDALGRIREKCGGGSDCFGEMG
jgi:hypothetical protein